VKEGGSIRSELGGAERELLGENLEKNPREKLNKRGREVEAVEDERKEGQRAKINQKKKKHWMLRGD